MVFPKNILELCYNQYVIENYLGGDSHPITKENFLEDWEDMTAEARRSLFHRACKQ